MIEAFSPKQRRVLTWWRRGSLEETRDAVICDGAVRSGKTLALGLSFFCWAMARYSHQQFALCGRTIEAVRRNLLVSVLPVLGELGFVWTEKRTRNLLTMRFGGMENTFYLFGGRDESSAGLIQGITLAGALLDEAALMPRSFVEQACARCSVTGAKLWFSCNPAGPGHGTESSDKKSQPDLSGRVGEGEMIECCLQCWDGSRYILPTALCRSKRGVTPP